MKALLTSLAFAISMRCACAAVIDVDPALTYLMTFEDVTAGVPAGDSVPIDLAALGFSPGDSVRLDSIGSYYYVYGDYGPGGQMAGGMVGVFSSSPTLLGNDQLNRVLGAIASGTPATTLNTWIGDYPTDVPQDFFITGGITLTIPVGAQYLFVSADDSFFSDNLPGPDGFKLLIEQVPDSCPTIVVAAISLLGIAVGKPRFSVR